MHISDSAFQIFSILGKSLNIVPKSPCSAGAQYGMAKTNGIFHRLAVAVPTAN